MAAQGAGLGTSSCDLLVAAYNISILDNLYQELFFIYGFGQSTGFAVIGGDNVHPPMYCLYGMFQAALRDITLSN